MDMLVGICVAALIFISGSALASPPPPESRDAKLMAGFEDWVRTQYTREGAWCCNLADGRPLDSDEVRVVDGHYEVKWATRHWPDGNDQWIKVDSDRLLHQASPIGMYIAWILNGQVFCLAMPMMN